MQHDILDVIKNLQTLSENNSAFKILKNFERVLDELDIYVFKNWIDGELIEGPIVSRYNVKCKFMWPIKYMPDLDGKKRLEDYGCLVNIDPCNILIPRKIKDPSDFRAGTKKGKIDAHPIWIVTIDMPKKLMQDVEVGKENQTNNKMAELMKYSKKDPLATNIPTEETSDEQPA
jgi:hypothetical protein